MCFGLSISCFLKKFAIFALKKPLFWTTFLEISLWNLSKIWLNRHYLTFNNFWSINATELIHPSLEPQKVELSR